MVKKNQQASVTEQLCCVQRVSGQTLQFVSDHLGVNVVSEALDPVSDAFRMKAPRTNRAQDECSVLLGALHNDGGLWPWLQHSNERVVSADSWLLMEREGQECRECKNCEAPGF